MKMHLKHHLQLGCCIILVIETEQSTYLIIQCNALACGLGIRTSFYTRPRASRQQKPL